MKTVQVKTEVGLLVERLSDERAARLVSEGKASYCPKLLWKAEHPKGPSKIAATSHKHEEHRRRNVRRGQRPVVKGV